MSVGVEMMDGAPLPRVLGRNVSLSPLVVGVIESNSTYILFCALGSNSGGGLT